MTRPFADRLSKVLGQQVIIENRGGASGAIGVEAMIKSPPDGYTFLATPSLTVVILPHLRKLSFDPLKDLVAVTNFGEGALLFTMHPSVPAKLNPGARRLCQGEPWQAQLGHTRCWQLWSSRLRDVQATGGRRHLTRALSQYRRSYAGLPIWRGPISN